MKLLILWFRRVFGSHTVAVHTYERDDVVVRVRVIDGHRVIAAKPDGWSDAVAEAPSRVHFRSPRDVVQDILAIVEQADLVISQLRDKLQQEADDLEASDLEASDLEASDIEASHGSLRVVFRRDEGQPEEVLWRDDSVPLHVDDDGFRVRFSTNNKTFPRKNSMNQFLSPESTPFAERVRRVPLHEAPSRVHFRSPRDVVQDILAIVEQADLVISQLRDKLQQEADDLEASDLEASDLEASDIEASHGSLRVVFRRDEGQPEEVLWRDDSVPLHVDDDGFRVRFLLERGVSIRGMPSGTISLEGRIPGHHWVVADARQHIARPTPDSLHSEPRSCWFDITGTSPDLLPTVVYFDDRSDKE